MTPKNFATLGLTAITTFAVALLVYSSGQPWATAKAGGPLFPGLKTDATGIERISVSQGDNRLTIEKSGERWLVKEKNGFPASAEKVRILVLAMSEANLAEAKTKREASFPVLELEDPKDNSANSHLVQLAKADGTVIAEAIVGKTRPNAFGAGKSGTYVRRPGDLQTWLIDQEVVAGTKLTDWTRERLFETKPESIKLATVEVEGDTSYDIVRESDGRTFKLARMPDGKKLKFANSADDIVDTLSSFNLAEARKLDSDEAKNSKASNTGIARLETDEGVKLYLKVRKDNAGHWMTMDASGYGNGMKAAADLMALAAGWEFKIPAAQAERIFKKQADILEDKAP
jgi:hypothetical protein